MSKFFSKIFFLLKIKQCDLVRSDVSKMYLRKGERMTEEQREREREREREFVHLKFY
jgi:hypothetical protein